MAPPLLVFDTATEHLAVALVTDAGVDAVDEPGGARASQRLLPLVGERLARAGLSPADLGAVGFGRGPGAFTGLRTACAVAQGLALAIDRPVLVLDTLAVVAEDAWRRGGPRGPASGPEVSVVQDARMGEMYAARYRRGAAGWMVVCDPVLTTPDAWWAATAADPPALVAGSALAAFADLAERLAAAGVPFDAAARPSAVALAVVAVQAWAVGAAVPVDQAEPLYVRDKVASTIDERAAARAAASVAVAAR